MMRPSALVQAKDAIGNVVEFVPEVYWLLATSCVSAYRISCEGYNAHTYLAMLGAGQGAEAFLDHWIPTEVEH